VGKVVAWEGLDALKTAFRTADDDMRLGLREISLEAAAEGIREARTNHPYTDRTYHLSGEGDGGSNQNSHAEQRANGDAVMVWPVEYASYVDQGTSRSRPYPFVAQAEERAEQVLAYGAEVVVNEALSKM
jgi:hypothetical protein